MPTPEFVLSLREKIGHDLLWLMGVSGYVEDEQGRVLLGRRSDTGEWAMVYGINEPERNRPIPLPARSRRRPAWMWSSPIWCRSNRPERSSPMRMGTTPCTWITCSSAGPIRMATRSRSSAMRKASTWAGSPLMLCRTVGSHHGGTHGLRTRISEGQGEWRFPCPVCLQRHHPLKSPSIHHKMESPQRFKRCGDSFLLDSVDQLTAGRQAAHADARDACAVRADRAPAGRPAASACMGSADSA